MLERAQTIPRIGPPIPIGQFTRRRLLVAVAIGGQANLDGVDDGLHMRRQPAMAGGELFAVAFQVQVELYGARAPGMDGAI